MTGRAAPICATGRSANGKARLNPPAREELTPPPRKTGKAPVLEIPPFTLPDPMRLPPREWLYGRHYARRTVSVTAAPGDLANRPYRWSRRWR